jgi:outer membrane protein W
MMLNLHHYLGERGNIRPYLGLNAGGFIMLQRFEMGIFSLQKDSFEWGLIPEVGAVIPLNRDTALLLQGKWTYAFTGKGIAGNDLKMQYWGITAGFAWQQY